MTLRQALKMNRPLHTPLHIKLIFALIAVAVLALPHHSHAFTLDTYAESSKLASGKWMKIRVPASGLYCIPVSTLRAWGFSDPAKVRVYGYGGRRIADRLRQSEYIDDLPPWRPNLHHRDWYSTPPVPRSGVCRQARATRPNSTFSANTGIISSPRAMNPWQRCPLPVLRSPKPRECGSRPHSP